MRAKEYVSKYKDRILLNGFEASDAAKADSSLMIKEMEHEINSAIAEMINEVIAEAKTIIETRKAKSLYARLAVYREVNDKWNSIAAAINKANGEPLLISNAIRAIYCNEIPQLRDLWDDRSVEFQRTSRLAMKDE